MADFQNPRFYQIWQQYGQVPGEKKEEKYAFL